MLHWRCWGTSTLHACIWASVLSMAVIKIEACYCHEAVTMCVQLSPGPAALISLHTTASKCHTRCIPINFVYIYSCLCCISGRSTKANPRHWWCTTDCTACCCPLQSSKDIWESVHCSCQSFRSTIMKAAAAGWLVRNLGYQYVHHMFAANKHSLMPCLQAILSNLATWAASIQCSIMDSHIYIILEENSFEKRPVQGMFAYIYRTRAP